MQPLSNPITSVIGHIPNRLALAGGWIDQPFVSMVVVSLQPTFRPMERAGIASGTCNVAMKMRNDQLPKRLSIDHLNQSTKRGQ